MYASLEILRLAQAFAVHAGLRQQAAAQNTAHADTPGYRARDAVPFAEFLARSAGTVGPGRAGQAPPVRPDDLLRPDAAPATRAPDGNTVSLEREMMRGAEIRAQHETALGIYGAARDLLRAAIGRAGR